jgi:cytidine kinase
MSLLVIGTLALDTIETPFDRRDNALGGSATYFCHAASYFTPARLVGVVGTDFPGEAIADLEARGVDCRGVETVEGKTFRWGGRYEEDWNTRHTLFTELGVFEHFSPKVPEEYRDSELVFLANAIPSVQMKALEQCNSRAFTLLDTMNLWIDNCREELIEVVGKVDGLVVNDEEARMLTDERNMLRAAHKLLELGPRYIVLKKGEHGAFLVGEGVHYAVPAYPVEEVVDPTGAGDSFAGGFMGYLASVNNSEAATLRRAMIYGTITASLCVEGFSTEKLVAKDRSGVESRFNRLLAMTTP